MSTSGKNTHFKVAGKGRWINGLRWVGGPIITRAVEGVYDPFGNLVQINWICSPNIPAVMTQEKLDRLRLHLDKYDTYDGKFVVNFVVPQPLIEGSIMSYFGNVGSLVGVSFTMSVKGGILCLNIKDAREVWAEVHVCRPRPRDETRIEMEEDVVEDVAKVPTMEKEDVAKVPTMDAGCPIDRAKLLKLASPSKISSILETVLPTDQQTRNVSFEEEEEHLARRLENFAKAVATPMRNTFYNKETGRYCGRPQQRDIPPDCEK
jgi:hypothetical protein